MADFTGGLLFQIVNASSQVLELELLCADGSTRTLSRDQDEELFRAALVGLGALGIVISFQLQCESAYNLREVSYGAPLKDVRVNPQSDFKQ